MTVTRTNRVDWQGGRGTDVLYLQPPSPPGREVLRDYAGGFGVSLPSLRSGYGHGAVTQPCLSLVYSATQAGREGAEVVFLDAQAEDMDLDRLFDRVAGLAPRVIISAVSLPSLESDLSILAGLKERTAAVIVATGTVCRVMPERVLAEDAVDAAVQGDLEIVGGDLLRRLGSGMPLEGTAGVAYRSGQGVTGHRPVRLRTLDDLPLPDFGLLPMRRYRTWEFGLSHHVLGKQFGAYPTYFPLYFSRGCPHGCRYCPYPLGFGSRHRTKSPQHAVEEFRAAAQAGVGHVLLRDQDVSHDPDSLAAFCRSLIRSGLRMEWMCEARLGSLDRGLLALMRRAGCVRLHYGVETGDASIMASEAKKGVESRLVAESLEATGAAGIRASAHFLIGFPNEDWESVGRTVELIRRLRISAGDCAILTPYPGTAYFKQMQAEGRVVASSWDEYTGSDPTVRLDRLSPTELRLARWRVLQAIAANNPSTLRSRASLTTAAFTGGHPPSLRAIERLVDLAFEDATRALDHPADVSSAQGGVSC